MGREASMALNMKCNMDTLKSSSKIIVLQGAPASGKSTWAREFVKGKKDWVIVCRDSFREGRGDYWIPEQEPYITSLERFAVKSAIERGLNVVIDATNLNPGIIQYWHNLFDSYHISSVEWKEFHIPIEEAIERDKNRERHVGQAVINKFYRVYYNEHAGEDPIC